MIAAATTKNAADDGSPGTSSSNGSGAPARARAPIRPSTLDRHAERGEHPLGVVAAGRGRHDLGRRRRPAARRASAPTSPARSAPRARGARRAATPPRIDSGAQRAVVATVDGAPIARNGSTTRAIGRARSDASPVSTERNGRPASTPGEHAHRRAAVPAVEHHLRLGSASTPAPWTTTVVGRLTADRRHRALERDARALRRRRRSARARDRARPVRERREQQRAVRDRLAPGQPQLPAQRARSAEHELVGRNQPALMTGRS